MREETKQSIRQDWIISAIIVGVMIIVAGYGLVQGVKALGAGISYAEARRATAECEKWNDWELVYPKWDEERQTGYFITSWQKSQCDTYGIELRGHLVDYKNN